MCRGVSGSEKQKRAEYDEEAQEHRISFIVRFYEPPGLPQIGVEEVDEGSKQESDRYQEDLQNAFAFHAGLFC